jgi:hypothetical protein
MYEKVWVTTLASAFIAAAYWICCNTELKANSGTTPISTILARYLK